MMSRKLLLVAVTGTLAGWLPSAQAQVQKNVIITNGLNGSPVTIPLDHTVDAGVDVNGNFVAACDLDGSGKCPNIGTTGGSTTITDYPGITINGPASPMVAAGGLISWSTTGAQSCYGINVARTSQGGPAAPVSTWGVSQKTADSYSLNTLFNSVGAGNTATYEFTLRCYSNAVVNDAGGPNLHAVGARDSKVSVTLSPPAGSTPGSDACSEYYPTGHSAYSQAGFQTTLTRADVPFNVFTTFSAGGSGSPVTFAQLIAGGISGQATLPGAYASSGKYISIPLDIPANTPDGHGFQIIWAEQQDVGVTAMPDSMELTVSPCPGDFRKRPVNDASPDYWDRKYCRRVLTTASGPLYFSVGTGNAPGPVCWLPKGKRVYLNMTMHNMDALRANPQSAPVSTCQLIGNTQCGFRFDVSGVTGY